MAELVGAVASGISIGTLAIGVTSSIVKLKNGFDQVYDAPEDINQLIEELEILHLVLAQMEENRQRYPPSCLILNSTSLSRCVQLCKQGLDPLEETAAALSADLDSKKKIRRKWGSVKVVLKKTQLNRYRVKLKQALRLLGLSHQLYMIALLQVQPDIVVAKMSGSPSPGPVSCDMIVPTSQSGFRSDSTASHDTAALRPRYDRAWCISNFLGTFRYRRIRYNVVKEGGLGYVRGLDERERIQAEYYWPSWLVNRVWNLQVVKACSGWTFSPRTYRIVPSESLVFQYAETNNVKGHQELFKSTLVSPFDCGVLGWAPLSVAARSCSYNACDFLVRAGADPNYLDWLGMTPLEILIHNSVDHREVQENSPLLWNESEHEVNLSYYQGSGEGFSGWQQALEPTYYQRPFEERLLTAKDLMSSNQNRYDVIRRALSLESLPLHAQDSKMIDGDFLNAVAASIAALPISNLDLSDVKKLSYEWRPFLVQLVYHVSSLHSIGDTGYTPFLVFLQIISIPCVVGDHDGHETRAWIQLLLKFWLECLRDGDVDLEDYGRKEMELYRKHLVSWVLRDCVRGGIKRTLRLETFTFGPSPSDWKVILYREDKVDVEQKYVPGAWIEDDQRGMEATDDGGTIYSRHFEFQIQDVPGPWTSDAYWVGESADDELSDQEGSWTGDEEYIDDSDDDMISDPETGSPRVVD